MSPKDPKEKVFSLKRLRTSATISKRLLSLIWEKERAVFVATCIGVTVPGVIPFVNAYIYKLIIDQVIAGIDAGSVSVYQLTGLLAARVVTYFLQDAAFSTQNYAEKLLWTKFPIHLNALILGRLAKLELQHFEDPKFKTALERMKESVGWRVQNVVSNILFAYQSAVQMLIAFVAIISLNWFLVFAVLVVAVPEFIYQLYESRAEWSIWNWNSPRKKRYTYLSWLIQDAPSVKELKIFALAPRFVEETTAIQWEFYESNRKLTRKSYIFELLFNVFGTALFIGVEIYVIVQAFARRVTIGDISFYTQIVGNFQNGISGFLRNVSRVLENAQYVESIFEVIDAPPLLPSSQPPVTVTSDKPPLIEFKNVGFKYPGSDTFILKNFSLAIQPGEKIAFVGENGAGKSTIIKLLVRFYDVTEGQILIDGTDLRELDLASWHRHVGVLFQDFNQYEDLVKKNIYYGNVDKGLDMPSIEASAHASGADDVVASLPEKYEQMLGKTFEQGTELSTGQWQKVALARAYFRNAPVLVLDEPTAAIDARAEHEIFERVEKLSADKTVIVISHRFSTVRMTNRIIVLKDGTILEQGSHEELMAQKGLYAELFALQAKGYQ